MGPRFPLRRLALAVAAVSVSVSLAVPALADTTLPTGGHIPSRWGWAEISTTGSAMTIEQHSQTLAIQWDDFSIGRDASVTFNQPNSAAVVLNRVRGNNLSRIDGQINANGHVFISNPNGILFGAGSQANVGSLVATTLDMDGMEFRDEQFVMRGNSTATIRNRGLMASNVVLVGAHIVNEGHLTAGNVLLVGTHIVNEGHMRAIMSR